MPDEVNISVSTTKVYITITSAEETVTVESQETVRIVQIGTVGPAGSSGFSGFSGVGNVGASGYSGYSGQDGAFAGSGYSGFSGPSGYSGFSAVSGYSGFSGAGISGYSGYSGAGVSGYSGYSGVSGPAGADGTSGYSGYSGAGVSGYSGYSGGAGSAGTSGFSGFSGAGTSGFSGFSGVSGYSGYSSTSGYSGFSGPSGYSGFTGVSGYSGFTGVSGYSGYSGAGVSGYSGYSGISGYSGYSSTSGYSGFSGPSGYSGFTGVSGYSGFTGVSGYSGYSGVGTSGYSGYSGISGYSGYSSTSGYSGFSGPSGYSGYTGISGYSGFSGLGVSGYSGYTGISGYSGYSGISGYSGYSSTSGYSGFSGPSGYSGYTGISGYSGFSGSGISGYSGYSGAGVSGYSGYSGPSGYSGYSGPSGYSGYTGKSGYSGYSGPSVLPTTEQTNDYTLVIGDAYTCVAMNKATANNLTVPLNATVPFEVGTQIVIEQRGAGTTTIVATGGVTINAPTLVMAGQYSVVALVKQSTDLWLLSTGSSGYSGYSGVSGYSGFSAVSGYSGFSGSALSVVRLAQNYPLSMVGGTVVSKAGTVTGTDGVGSSFFLHRITIPGPMGLSEVDCAMSIGFPATNQGAGTMSRSLGIYLPINNTSLVLYYSTTGTSAWATGTSTAGGNTSLTQYQGGWSFPLIQPMTFASVLLPAAEYIVGQLFNFAQASSTWTLAFYGVKAESTFLASAATNLTSATLGAMSSGGLIAGSVLTGLTQIVTANAANTVWEIDRGSSAGSSAKISSSVFTVVQHAWVSSLLTLAGSLFSASTSIGAVTNVALGALNSSTLAQLTFPNFGYIGTGSTTSGLPTAFFCGIMSTGGMPSAITLTSTAVTYSGTAAFQIPWVQLVGT